MRVLSVLGLAAAFVLAACTDTPVEPTQPQLAVRTGQSVVSSDLFMAQPTVFRPLSLTSTGGVSGLFTGNAIANAAGAAASQPDAAQRRADGLGRGLGSHK